jgi:hypothetical protein
MKFDILLEAREKQSIHYYCIASEHHRYDLAVVYSEKFFGKAMVTSIQKGSMVLLCQEDIQNESYWAPKLGIESVDVQEFQKFLRFLLPPKQIVDEY